MMVQTFQPDPNAPLERGLHMAGVVTYAICQTKEYLHAYL